MKTIEEVCKEFKIHRNTLHRWVKSGKINTVKVGKKRLIDDEEFERIKKVGIIL